VKQPPNGKSDMKVLLKGTETKQRIDLLLQLTKATSPNKKQALYDYFCNGKTMSLAAVLNSTTQPKLSNLIANIEQKAQVVEQLHALKAKR